MTAVSVILALFSAVAHSQWNLLLKRAGDPVMFAWCLLVVASILLTPVGLALLWYNSVGLSGLGFLLATIALHALYFNLLSRGYARGDLSLVYPVARGMGPMLMPVLAVIFLNETIAPIDIVGIAAIIGGIYTIS